MFIEITAVMAPRHRYHDQLGRCSEPLWPLSLKSSLLSPTLASHRVSRPVTQITMKFPFQ